MPNISRNFIQGKMNKMVDERLVPNGEYIDGLNIRMGSTEGSEIGVVENTKGNTRLTTLTYNGIALINARCIGAFEDGANESVYWFISSNSEPVSTSPTGKVDMVVSFNTTSNLLTYHIISVDDGGGVNTTLNFDSKFLITGVNKIENLVFFTDNLNPPRQFNILKNYGNPVSNIDSFTGEAIQVLKRPPITSPSIRPLITNSEDNFLENRFICFAYRYRYEDGEYSATSQFSEPSFVPNIFDYDTATALNAGMLNTTNMCDVTYNSGGPLVKEIDLLFKDMNNSIIKVIEKLDKEELGYADNTEYTFTFSNSKIFTILPVGEILRLYDNVPKIAQSQTLMGNRLMYGNYLEGYDLSRENTGSPVSLVPTQLQYFTSLTSEQVGRSDLSTTTISANYTINGNVSSIGTFSINLTDKFLVAGSIIDIFLRWTFNSYNGQTPFPVEEQAPVDISFQYTLQQNYSSAYALSIDADFIERIGNAATIQTVQNSCSASTFTDLFNCEVDNDLDTLFKVNSGISAIAQPIKIISFPSSELIFFQIPAVQYVDSLVPANVTQTVYSYYDITLAQAAFQEIGDPKSLKSNRDYEIGIVYMDDYNRASSALVSPNNTQHVGCSLSDSVNKINVTIPIQQIAPSWAKRYKFCIKPDKGEYDIIYSNFFFRDPTSGANYFLLDGQNSQKIEEGDELLVKTDTNGVVQRCTRTTVLEKKAQPRDFLDPPPINSADADIAVPSGVYMKIRANNFNTILGDYPVIAYGEKVRGPNSGGCQLIQYPVDVENIAAPGQFIDYTVPQGSRINMVIKNLRRGKNNVGEKRWEVEAKFVSSDLYTNFKNWFEGDSIAAALEAQATNIVGGMEGPNYNATTLENCGYSLLSCRFNTTGAGTLQQRTFFEVRSSKGYRGNNRKAVRIEVDIVVIRAEDTIVFESDSQDAEPDLWYESSDSFAIDAIGQHSGNTQNQVFSTNTPAIIKTDFFNCFAFGNGVESFKIQDSITGRPLVLGNRALTTQGTEFEQAERLSDITYSGIYNEESNVNKLNEFNGGLLNFKSLEASFGPIQKLFARETDVLVLQEDKISYVLAGKNLLSDAGAGNLLTTVPEVLGTQIARIEEFGISSNPESFAIYGASKYFTDAKRGAVIMLKGQSARDEQLQVVSTFGLRGYFRDLFQTSFQTQKLGGFDPYMNEYVLSNNQIKIPSPVPCLNCGITQTFTSSSAKTYSFCVNFGSLVGDVNLTYKFLSAEGNSINLAATYNGVTVNTGAVTTNGVLTFDKDKVNEESADIVFTANGAGTVELTYACPAADSITIQLVQVNSANNGGEFITNEYRWKDGTFVSPLHKENVKFATGNSPIVSLYKSIQGLQGGGVIPADGSVVTMLSNKIQTDDYNFVLTQDKFRFLRSNTLYNNNSADITALITASAIATPIAEPSNGNTAFSAEFTMPSVGTYLYLIWDYRNSTSVTLCAGASPTLACCGCSPTP